MGLVPVFFFCFLFVVSVFSLWLSVSAAVRFFVFVSVCVSASSSPCRRRPCVCACVCVCLSVVRSSPLRPPPGRPFVVGRSSRRVCLWLCMFDRVRRCRPPCKAVESRSNHSCSAVLISCSRSHTHLVSSHFDQSFLSFLPFVSSSFFFFLFPSSSPQPPYFYRLPSSSYPPVTAAVAVALWHHGNEGSVSPQNAACARSTASFPLWSPRQTFLPCRSAVVSTRLAFLDARFYLLQPLKFFVRFALLRLLVSDPCHTRL